MQIGMIGLGRMGSNMVKRLVRAGHSAVVHDRSPEARAALEGDGAINAASLDVFVKELQPPRVIWLMVPAAVVDDVIASLEPLVSRGDIIIDGGNSHYQDAIARSKALAAAGIHYLDVGTSGGVWGLERGYCLMVGGDPSAVKRIEPLLQSLAPGRGSVPPTKGRESRTSTADQGYLHCGPSGAGHFVKMIHNGIEYGLMAAYAEGLNILSRANVGKSDAQEDAETTPLRTPEHYQYDFNLADITELWRRGSVIQSWLLDLTTAAFAGDPKLAGFEGTVADSGEGRWTLQAANDEGVPAHVLAAALFERFGSRDHDLFQNKVLSAMRFGFGGHMEQK
ncbi:MAG: decarboxylating 6-phosphogluconate dehydrogenase [Cyanobacteria bacterium]|nr:decarboxylating 6-phosphogluconate dehydrogenase [Cyanobacteriota bacterium]